MLLGAMYAHTRYSKTRACSKKTKTWTEVRFSPVSVLLLDELYALLGLLLGDRPLQQVRFDAHVTHYHHHLRGITVLKYCSITVLQY